MIQHIRAGQQAVLSSPYVLSPVTAETAPQEITMFDYPNEEVKSGFLNLSSERRTVEGWKAV